MTTENQAPEGAPAQNAQRQNSTVYVLNDRGSNRWWASVQAGHDDDGRRVSDDECEAVAEAIRAALAAQPQAAPARCPYCDNTGDVHTPTGEWRGVCTECNSAADLATPAPAAGDVTDKREAIATELGLIASVLRGYPPGMARADALRAVAVVQLAVASICNAYRAAQPDVQPKGTGDPNAELVNEMVAHLKAQAPVPALAETMTLQEVWDAMGGNPGIAPSRADVLLQLKLLDQICDEADAKTQAPAVTHAAGERDAFEAVVAKEAGTGATKRWLGTDAYENHRINDNRMGWVWCLEWMKRTGFYVPVQGSDQ